MKPAQVPEHNRHAGQGPVVLDVGDGVGALIVLAPESYMGREVEALRVGRDLADHAPHAAVLGRPTRNGTVYCAVITDLVEGRYALRCRPDGPVALHVDVHGGEVHQAQWPGDHHDGRC